MELKATNHNYYSSETNYYVNGQENYGRYEADTWDDFKREWLFDDLTIDHDYNHCFRFDILEHRDSDTDEVIEGKYSLWLFFVLQRKGIYRPVLIKNVNQEDMPEIEVYLKSCWSYLQEQWTEFNQIGE